MTIGRRVPEGHSPAVIARVDPGAAFDQELNDIRSTSGRSSVQGRESSRVGGRRAGRPRLEEQVEEGRAVDGAEQRWSTNAIKTRGGVGVGRNEKLRDRNRRIVVV